MPITLNNSPIVELIAEMRWDTPSQALPGPQVPGAPTGIVTNQADCESFFMRFTGHAFALGFQQMERLAPHGFPIFSHQPVFRFRSNNTPGLLYQIGAGYFSVHATPPYRTWDDFSPIIRSGLEALIAARGADENELPFPHIGLRYLDAFKEPLTRGRDIASFMSEVLGITLALPHGISKHIMLGNQYKPSLQLQIPMLGEKIMQIGIGEGMSNNEPAFIMDTTVTTTSAVQPDIDVIMNTLNASHAIIHEMFFEITAPIMELMQPTEGA
ncbi:MAG: TIGR04255 family protein [Pseudomonadota bacterium]